MLINGMGAPVIAYIEHSFENFCCELEIKENETGKIFFVFHISTVGEVSSCLYVRGKETAVRYC